mmetsp:Transcript_74104/g.176524  ORF Transcript_74104/g.176524 Transcript_74104/m.176524 type:complete len:679 (+) Transcript_74104:241-2277(+)
MPTATLVTKLTPDNALSTGENNNARLLSARSGSRLSVTLQKGTTRSNSRLGDVSRQTSHLSRPSSNGQGALSRGFSRSTPCQSRLSVGRGSGEISDNLIGRLTEHPWFQNTTLAVICVNALWIGADVEWNNEALRRPDEDDLPWEPWSTAVENVFCVYFTTEIVLRFVAFRWKRYCIKDAWFVFDAVLVIFMILETWLIPIVQLFMSDAQDTGSLSSLSALRILRLSRMVRLSRSVPELRTLVKSMLSGLKATASILVFLLLMMWLFAIIFTDQLSCDLPYVVERIDGNCPHNYEPHDVHDGYCRIMDDGICPPHYDLDDGAGNRGHIFGSLGSSMMTLFTNGVLGDNLYQTLDIVWADGDIQGLLMYWLFGIFFLLTALTLLNMLIGVLIDTISQTAKGEASSMWETDFKFCMENAFAKIDTDESGTVTLQEWIHIREDEEVRRTLAFDLQCDEESVDIQMDKIEAVLFCGDSGASAKKSVFKSLHNDQGQQENGVDFNSFVQSMLELRPDKQATPLDLALLESYLAHNYTHLIRALTRIEARVEQVVFNDGECSAPTSAHSMRSELSNKSSPSISGRSAARGSQLREISPTRSTVSEVVLPMESSVLSLHNDTLLPSKAQLTGDAFRGWLHEVPTSVLFSVLKQRASASPQPLPLREHSLFSQEEHRHYRKDYDPG